MTLVKNYKKINFSRKLLFHVIYSFCRREKMITYINQQITFDQLCDEMRDICKFSSDQLFTMKWIDDEGDPCTLSNQMELDEAIRLYDVNKESELVVHGE